MNMDININTSGLQNNINNIKKLNEEMSELFKEIETKEKFLETIWISDVSEPLYVDFHNLYNKFSSYEEQNNEYVNFLIDIVNNNYQNTEDDINNLVDTNLVTKE
jgi:hypothetical protein